MSKLNVYHHELRHNEYAEFCLKYEVDDVLAEKDKVIAELKAENERLKRELEHVKNDPAFMERKRIYNREYRKRKMEAA